MILWCARLTNQRRLRRNHRPLPRTEQAPVTLVLRAVQALRVPRVPRALLVLLVPRALLVLLVTLVPRAQRVQVQPPVAARGRRRQPLRPPLKVLLRHHLLPPRPPLVLLRLRPLLPPRPPRLVRQWRPILRRHLLRLRPPLQPPHHHLLLRRVLILVARLRPQRQPAGHRRLRLIPSTPRLRCANWRAVWAPI